MAEKVGFSAQPALAHLSGALRASECPKVYRSNWKTCATKSPYSPVGLNPAYRWQIIALGQFKESGKRMIAAHTISLSQELRTNLISGGAVLRDITKHKTALFQALRNQRGYLHIPIKRFAINNVYYRAIIMLIIKSYLIPVLTHFFYCKWPNFCQHHH